MSREDVAICQERQLSVRTGDMNFLPERDESVDLLFCRHALEHSPFPYFSLLEYNRVLKPGAYLYVEVPAPDCDRQHEDNRNHYSIMGKTMWLQLLKRAGFDVNWHEYEFPIKDNDDTVFQERYYIFVCQRRRPVDVKQIMAKEEINLVKAPHQRISYTDQQLQEFAACADPVDGPLYFMDNFFIH